MGYLTRQLSGATEPATDAGWQDAPDRKEIGRAHV